MKIEIFALGGLGENGKNLYVVEVDKRIFVLDAGIKYPDSELLGIDQVIPDYSYLVKNKDRIEGIFLTHGHDVHIGALPFILSDIKLNVYASNFTMDIIEDLLVEEGLNSKAYNLIRVNENTLLKFKTANVGFFQTTHNIPDSYGVYIETKDGLIVYTSDYTFDQNADEIYKTNYDTLTKISQKGVLALLSDSLGADKFGNNGNYHANMYKLNNIMKKAKNRLIFSVYSQDLRRIQKLIDLCVQYDKKVAIIGRKTQRIVDIGIKSGYLKIPENILKNLKYIDDKNKNDDPNLVILVTGIRHEPYYMIQRMCKGIDRLINITNKDHVIFMTAPYLGTEKLAAKTLDSLAKIDAEVTVFKRKDLQYSHAFSEEIKLMYKLLKPKYAIPAIGEYRHQHAHKNICLELGYKEEDIFILENGESAVFVNKEFKEINKKIEPLELLVDGSIAGDINEVVLKDRELLSEDGILIITANVNARIKKVLNEPKIVTKGFLFVKDNEEILNEIKNIFKKVSQEFLKNKYIKWNDYKNVLRNEINNYIQKTTQRSPLVIPVIISTEL